MNITSFADAIRDQGYEPPEITADGNLHRFPVNGNSHDKAGWFVLFSDGPILAGAFGDWRSGQKFTWSEKSEKFFSDAERAAFGRAMARARKLRHEARRHEQAEAQQKAVSIWEQAQPAGGDDHAYLKKKGVSSYGLRTHKEALVMPLRDSNGRITTLQFIDPDGEKRFLTGGKKQHSFFDIPGEGDSVYLVEGYATGATIHEATGGTVIVCCDAGNMKPVAEVIQSNFSKEKIIICADNDAWTDGNPGIAKGREAAAAIQAQIVSPKFTDTSTQPTDFNDLHQLEGLSEVTRQLKRAKPAKVELLDELQEALGRNEEGDALLIKRRFEGHLVFDHREGIWYRFEGHHWHRDEINNVLQVVIATSDLFAEGAIKCLDAHKQLIETTGPELDGEAKTRAKRLSNLREKFLKRASALRGESRAKNVLSWAAAGEPLGVTSEVWEPDPWLLGVLNGVVELRTGQLRPGRPEDYIRTFSPIAYNPDAACPTWEKFILDIFAQPDESDTLRLFDYFQKLLGYTLIGNCREAIFVILYGEGRNGKTTLLETIRYILGPYSFKANSELVLKKSRPSGPGSPDSETLSLRHRRFVFCAETEEGRRLDGNRVKHLCGNDCLTARGLYEKRPTEFLPTHTLYLTTNDKPQIRSDDFAIWQRIKPVPFLVSFVDDPKGDWQKLVDKDMQKKLMAEASGILTWLVDGCLIYQKEGLETPAIVSREAQEYRSAESLLQQWAGEFCVIRQYSEAGSKELFDSFTKWLTDNGHAAWSHKTFSDRIVKEFREYGVEKKKTMTGAVFYNIGLKP